MSLRAAPPWMLIAALSVGGCRPSDVLTVPPPAGVTVSSAYRSQSGAEGLLTIGKSLVFQGVEEYSDGLLPWTSVLGDEFTWSDFIYAAPQANIDARRTAGAGGFQESADLAIDTLMKGRLTLLSAAPLLEQYEPASGQAKTGEAFALTGYVELLAAEDYCAGLALAALVPVKGIQYGMPLTMDSLLAVAEADFDSAAAHSGGDTQVAP